jgi:dienelactone hydrolase
MPISPQSPRSLFSSNLAGLRRPIAVVAVAIVLAASACSDSPEGTGGPTTDEVSSSNIASRAKAEPVKVAEVNTYGVGSVADVKVDDSRTTMAHGGAPELPQRSIGATVYYPADTAPTDEVTPDAPPSKEGPFPLLAFSHGIGHSGPVYKNKLQKIASAGYVVVAATHPLSNSLTPGGATAGDLEQQAGDLSFLLDEVLDTSDEPTGPFSGLVDPDRLGAFGHSLGAITALGVGFEDCCADKRLKAVAEWSGIFMPLGGDGTADLAEMSEDRPLLIVHGDQDSTIAYSNGQDVFGKATGPKYLVTLPGQGHVIPFVTGLDSPASAATTLTTVDFFDRYLKDDPKGIDRLKAAATATPGAATLEVGGQEVDGQ